MKETWKKQGGSFKGKKHTEESKKKMSDTRKGLLVGSKNGRWKGGNSISYARYQMKNINHCLSCDKEVSCRQKHVHHIDMNQQNNERSNLVVLCAKHHKQLHVTVKKLNTLNLPLKISWEEITK